MLRRATFALARAGHRATLLAPAAPAAVLRGPGEAADVLPWDGPEMASLLAEGSPGGPVEAALAAADAVVALTRSAPALEALGRRARRLVVRDPTPPAGGPHASLWLAGALESLGLDARRDPDPLVFTEAELRAARDFTTGLPDGFLAVHPGSGSPAKNWPLERFVEAARRLSPGRPWLLVLGPAEERVPTPAGACPALGLPLRTLGAILARAGLYLGNDSGISHLAAASGTRTLALFGPTDPAQWAPVGPAVRTLRAPTHDLADLPVDEVVQLAGDPTIPTASSASTFIRLIRR